MVLESLWILWDFLFLHKYDIIVYDSHIMWYVIHALELDKWYPLEQIRQKITLFVYLLWEIIQCWISVCGKICEFVPSVTGVTHFYSNSFCQPCKLAWKDFQPICLYLAFRSFHSISRIKVRTLTWLYQNIKFLLLQPLFGRTTCVFVFLHDPLYIALQFTGGYLHIWWQQAVLGQRQQSRPRSWYCHHHIL